MIEASMRPYGRSAAYQTSLGLSRPHLRHVDEEVVLVRHRQAHLGDLRVRLQHRLAHRVERLLQRQAVHRRERVEHDRADAGVGLVPVDVRTDVAPPRGDDRGHDPVRGLDQRGVLHLGEAVELAAGALEDRDVLQPGDDRLVVAVLADDGGAHLGAALDERVVVLGALGGDDAVPEVLLHLLARAGHPRVLVDEVARHAQREVLDRADAAEAGQRVHRVLLGVGRDDGAVVAGGVGVGGEVADQLAGDVHILDLVHRRRPVDVHQPDLGFAVLVGAQDDGHARSSSGGITPR